MRKMMFVILLISASAFAADSSSCPTDAERAHWTLYDIRIVRTAIEGYARVHNEYPAASSMEDLRALLVPNFIKVLPMRDAWGTPFLYERNEKHGYRVVSAGSDHQFDRSKWDVGGTTTSYDDDAVANGDQAGWFRYWEAK